MKNLFNGHTDSELKEYFDSSNKNFLDGELPDINVQYGDKMVSSYLGQFRALKNNTSIILNALLTKDTDDNWKSVLLHAMIHFWIYIENGLGNIPNETDHGKFWTEKAAEITKKSGIRITVSDNSKSISEFHILQMLRKEVKSSLKQKMMKMGKKSIKYSERDLTDMVLEANKKISSLSGDKKCSAFFGAADDIANKILGIEK